jgi:toxin-antitoxin system PIN domain toxin
MKYIDANILLYAVHRRTLEHERVRRWWETVLNGDEPIGLTWIVVIGFLRLATRPGVFEKPLSLDTAISHVDEWLAQPIVRVVIDSDAHWRYLSELLRQTGTASNLTTDAHLAAIALGNGATIVSCDADFGRFRQIQWENPLIESG